MLVVMRDPWCGNRLAAGGLVSAHRGMLMPTLQRAGRAASLLVIALGLALVTPSSAATDPAPESTRAQRVLVINSYHWGFRHSDDQIDGMLSVLRTSTVRPEVYVEQMDVLRERRPFDDGAFLETIRTRLREHRFDLVVVLDDAALAFLLRYHALFEGTPVLFSDVGEFAPETIPPGLAITGVHERVPVEATKKLARKLRPNAKQVIIFGNDTGRLTGAEHAHRTLLAYQDEIPVHSYFDLDADAMVRIAAQASAEDIIIPLAYAFDANGQWYSYDEMSRRISAVTRAAQFDISSNRVRNGTTLGGVVEDEEAEGRLLGQLAMRVLHGEDPRGIPVVGAPVEAMFHYRHLVDLGIPDRALPARRIVVGRPPDFLADHREVVIATAAVIGVLLAALLAMLLNIRRRMRVEAMLRGSEERFRFVLEATSDGIWDWNPATGEILVNPRYFTMLGYAVGAIKSHHDAWSALIHPDDWARAERTVRTNLGPESQGFAVEFRMRRASGEWCPVLARGKAVAWDRQGSPTRVCGSHIDLTERHRAEEALRIREQRFRHLIERSSDGILLLDADRCITYASPSCECVLGRPAHQWIGRSVLELVEDRGADAFNTSFVELLDHPGATRAVRAPGIRSDATVIPLEGVLTNLLGVTSVGAVVFNFRDVTERERQQGALLAARDEAEGFRRMVEFASQAIGTGALDGRVLYQNPAHLRLFGLASLEDARKHNYREFYDEAERARLEGTAIPAAIAQGGWVGEVAIRRRDGSEVPTIHHLFPLRDNDGRPAMLACVVTDITRQKATETALRASEAKYRTLFEQALEGIALVEPATGDVVDCNQSFAEICGWPRDELIGQSIEILRDSASAARGDASGDWTTSFRTSPAGVVHRDGSRREVETRVDTIRAEGKLLTRLMVRDVTERRRAEALLTRRILALTQPLDAAADIEFEELFDLAEIQRLQDLLGEALGVASLITRPDGVPLTEPSNFSRMCLELIRPPERARHA
jgi:PAS domain S-box-containing protein